jgi:hypothetical protein
LKAQLYGNQSRPVINYPKPKTKQFTPAPKFIPGGAKATAADPRAVTRRDVNIMVPKMTGGARVQRSICAVDLIPKRRHENVIRTELDDIRMRQERFRPAYTHASSTEAEKDRLNQIFTFKGGKGLPDELTHPIGEAPFEAAARRKEQDRLATVREKRFPSKPERKATQLSPTEGLQEQIVAEINERREYLESMQGVGLSEERERTIKGEISHRIFELRKLEKSTK